jgi:hypothetical protein
MASITALKGKKLSKKKTITRRKTTGAKAAPLDDYKKHTDYFHFNVDSKECVTIVKAHIKKIYNKERSKIILKNKESLFAKQFVAAYCHWLAEGKDAPEDSINWMSGYFDELYNKGLSIVEEVKAEEAKKPKNIYVPSIQERIKEASGNIIAEIEDQVDKFIEDPKAFKKFDSVKFFRSMQVNQAHARHIRSYYEVILGEYLMLQEPVSEQDEQLREGYAHLDKADIKKAVELFQGIVGACDLITAESKASRKTRSPKPKSAEKLVAKMKYCKSDEKYKVASINPSDIIGCNELWIFNTKTRKIGKYIAEEHQTLQVKGTTLQFFNEKESIAKTLRKPEQQLAEFNKSGKVQLRKFLPNIKGVETKLNGRINNDTVILKAVNN